jgi:hypothetical protein
MSAKRKSNKRNSYEVDVICYNCDFKGEVDVNKGIQIKEAVCPKCGNKTLRQALPGEAG